jgi:hypothetical protein
MHVTMSESGFKACQQFVHLYSSWLIKFNLSSVLIIFGVRGGAVGWGTALQAGRLQVRFPMVSLEFFH